MKCNTAIRVAVCHSRARRTISLVLVVFVLELKKLNKRTINDLKSFTF